MIAAALVALAMLAPADDVARAEQQRLEAMRSGQGIVGFYSPAYRGISALGRYETFEQIQAITANANYARLRDVSVEMHDDTAIVTGVEGASDAERERVLRIWTRQNGAWTIAAAHSTWIGMRTGAPPASGPLPNTPVEPVVPQTIAETSLWFAQETLMRSFADADPESYKVFSTDTSLRMQTNGDPIPRDQWLATIARRQKGPLAVVDEVKMSFYGDVAVVNLRGHEANPTRQSWVYLREGGLWKLHLRFTTLIRQP